MKLTVFSVAEANRVVADVRPRLEQLSRAKREFDRTQGRIEVLAVALSGASRANPDRTELHELQDRRTQLGHDIAEGIETIQRRGCLVKDLDRGLLDFYAISGDRLIFLCWHLGEQEIRHWHPLEGGFSARQPLDASDL
jgi:hypothetical protein